jgi:hypothetical protein
MSQDARQAWEIASVMALAWMLALVFGRLPSKGYPMWIKRTERPGIYWTLMAAFLAACLAVAYLGLRA